MFNPTTATPEQLCELLNIPITPLAGQPLEGDDERAAFNNLLSESLHEALVAWRRHRYARVGHELERVMYAALRLNDDGPPSLETSRVPVAARAFIAAVDTVTKRRLYVIMRDLAVAVDRGDDTALRNLDEVLYLVGATRQGIFWDPYCPVQHTAWEGGDALTYKVAGTSVSLLATRDLDGRLSLRVGAYGDSQGLARLVANQGAIWLGEVYPRLVEARRAIRSAAAAPLSASSSAPSSAPLNGGEEE